MLPIYVTCGEWRLFESKEWRLIVDKEKRGRLLSLQSTTSLEELKVMVLEDYGIEGSMVDVEFSYLPTGLSVEFPPVVMMNDRQVKNFIECFKRKNSIPLCVTFKDRFNFDLNKEPTERDDDAKEEPYDSAVVDNDGKERHDSAGFMENSKDNTSKAYDDVVYTVVESMVDKGRYFPNKEALQATMEMYAMKNNCDYFVTKSDPTLWYIRCKDRVCKWSLRAICLEESTIFKVNKYIGNHTCAPSMKNKFCKTPSARTIGHLIMHNYEGMKEGPKPNDIIRMICKEYGCELLYSLAWESREYAVNEVRGILQKSYGKIPK